MAILPSSSNLPVVFSRLPAFCVWLTLMGERIDPGVSGPLYWVPLEELERIRRYEGDREVRAALFADACRLNALYMIARAGSGHIGSSFSSLDIVAWLYLEELHQTADSAKNDVYFSSKGHDAPGLYAVLTALGRLPFSNIHALRRLGGLPGHPDVSVAGIAANTGSLGMGISKAKGMALARRIQNRSGRLYVLLGDGELQEGQIWEALLSAPRHQLSELTLIVDHNKLQSDALVERTSPLGDLIGKFESFGAYVDRIDGHDFGALAAAFDRARSVRDRLCILVADTIKGRGVSFMEHTSPDSDLDHYRYHSGAPNAETYGEAVAELASRLASRANAAGVGRVTLASADPQEAAPPATLDRSIPAYERALTAALERFPHAVALDADLLHDTGQAAARARFPDRVFECGIAEMDMVSMAGGMAREGLLPICHSFACFLSTRPNEHIYNNASERSKIVYVASLAGLLPAGPGHSHQSVRDISALAAIPDLVMLAPSCAAEVEPALEWCLTREAGSSVLRLESIPWPVPFDLPAGHQLREGVGSELRPGNDLAFVGYGPVMLSEAWQAAATLADRGISAAVINLPWLNRIDRSWLARVARSVPLLVTLDNHYLTGGQGEQLAAALLELGFDRPPRVRRMGVEGLPASGASLEVLKHHQLDAESLVERVMSALSSHLR
jgi:transketolase